MPGPLSTYNKLRMANPQVQLPGDAPLVMPQQSLQVQQPQPQPQMPQVDTSNAIQSLAQLMGPTPAEREAQERKLLENKRKMIAWTGLFDGLRQLGNLYYATKGATPQQYTDKPYQAIEQNYQQERQLQDYANRYSQAYAKQLFDWQQKMSDTERRNKIADAQANYYNTRDEMARLKGENDRLRAEQQASVNEARRKQIELKTKQLEELHPLQKQKLQAMIKNTLHNANRPYGGSRGGSRSSRSSSDPFEELATQLNDNPDIIGPILEQEGLGFYDNETKEFNFSKNATKGMATTATRRAATQRAATQRQAGGGQRQPSSQRQSGGNKNTGKRKSRTRI